MLQPAVKLRPFFWTKLPANKVNIWSRVQPPIAELEKGQMAALEQLFAQTESRVTPGKKKGAAEGNASFCVGESDQQRSVYVLSLASAAKAYHLHALSVCEANLGSRHNKLLA